MLEHIQSSGKFWHWSYGDRYWALETGAPTALYGPSELPATTSSTMSPAPLLAPDPAPARPMRSGDAQQ